MTRPVLWSVGLAAGCVAAAWLGVSQAGRAMAAACADAPPAPTTSVQGGPLPMDRSFVTSLVVGSLPGDLEVDSRTGRVWVPVAGADHVSAFDQYPNTPRIGPRMDVDTGKGSDPASLAVDSASGRVWVALVGTCEVIAIDGRSPTPGIVARIELGHSPSGIAVDPVSGRAFVSFAAAGKVGTIEPGGSGWTEVPSRELAVGVGPAHLAFDQTRNLLFVSNEGPPGSGVATGQESLTVLATSDDQLKKVGDLPLSVPTKIAVDAANGLVYVTENGNDLITVLKLDNHGVPTILSQIGSDVAPNAGNNRNPVGLVVLPGSGDIVVSQYGSAGAADDTQHLEIFRPDGTSLKLVRAIAGVDKAVGIALDPTSGRVWVTEREASRVSGFQLDSITATRLPPPLPAALPGPFDVSWAPAAVARSLGLAVLVMLLLGAPTPLFNHTLEANLDEIRRLLGMDRLLRAVGSPALRPLLRSWSAAAGGWIGLAGYLLLAAIILSLAEPGFPQPDGLPILIATALSIALVTAARLLPDRQFMLRRFGDRGRVHVVGWVLAIAVGCVLLSRVAGAVPAYVYGIIGAYEFQTVPGSADRGRRALWAGVTLLALALAAWFIRIPLEPSIERPALGASLVVNDVLVKVFVAAVEGIVIGFIPLRFMPGNDLFAWKPWLWVVVWGVGLLLFMHVILYAPTDFVPDPDVTPLITIILTVAVYGLVAVGFWALFARRRAGRIGGGDEPRPDPASDIASAS